MNAFYMAYTSNTGDTQQSDTRRNAKSNSAANAKATVTELTPAQGVQGVVNAHRVMKPGHAVVPPYSVLNAKGPTQHGIMSAPHVRRNMNDWKQ